MSHVDKGFISVKLPPWLDRKKIKFLMDVEGMTEKQASDKLFKEGNKK